MIRPCLGFALAVLCLTCEFGRGDDPEAPKPINLDKLNTARDEDDPHLATSGLVLYYTSNAKGKRELMASARANRNTPWPAGKALLHDTGKSEVRGAFITPEGRYPQYLYFATDRDSTNEKDLKGDNFDVYFLIRQRPQAEWTTQTPLHSVCTAADEAHPWLTADGLHLYFSRKTKEGWRIYAASKPRSGGAFGEPRRMDLPPGFHHPTLTPDGRTMYVQGPLPNNRWGIFRTTALTKGWTKPEPVEELNSAEAPTGDQSPSLSRDGALLYFASDRPGGKGGLDLWMVPLGKKTK